MRRLLALLVLPIALWASNPPTLARPAPGATVVDPVFGYKIIRISSPDEGGVCTHTYSTWSPFNADRTKLLMICWPDVANSLTDTNQSQWLVSLASDGTPGTKTNITSLALRPTVGYEWDRMNPNLIYYLPGDATIRSYDFATSTSALVKDFSAVASTIIRITMSDDNDVFALVEDSDTKVLAWRRSTDTILVNATMVAPKPEIDATGAWIRAGNAGAACVVRVSDSAVSCCAALDSACRAGGHGDTGTANMIHWDGWDSALIRHDYADFPVLTNWHTLFNLGQFGYDLHLAIGGPSRSHAVVGV